MAKKLSLIAAAKQAATARPGPKRWIEELTPAQKKEFFDFLDWFKATPQRERPTNATVLDLVEKTFGRAIAERTLRNYLDGRWR